MGASGALLLARGMQRTISAGPAQPADEEIGKACAVNLAEVRCRWGTAWSDKEAIMRDFAPRRLGKEDAVP
jgi:hypothetical protein